MQALNAPDGRIGFVLPGEFLQPLVLDGGARAFGDFSQR